MSDDDTDSRLGQVLGGKYRVDALIGQGGLGRVYRGTHLTLGGSVAIKFVIASSMPPAEARERFRREATALAALRHPGIVAAYDFGDDGVEPYLVMECVEGAPLADAILSLGRTMPFRRIAAITQQIARVLEAAHAAQIVQRDLKPDNVMLVDAGGGAEHVKVLDFGIALALGAEPSTRLTATNAVQGTPLYMSPEQCRGRDVGPAADIYSLGALLYEMLAGEPPFDGESAADLMTKHMFVAPAPLAERGVGRAVPPDLEELCLRALSKKPEDRPTATEVLLALDAFLGGNSVLAFAQQATEERIRAVALSRRDRGLPEAGTPLVERERAAEKVTHASGEERIVALWGFTEARAETLAPALATNGLVPKVWRGQGTPVAAKGRPTRAVAVAGGAEAEQRVRDLRALGDGGDVPIIVVDVGGAADTVALVRAGASDVALVSIGDDALCAKISRMIRRRR